MTRSFFAALIASIAAVLGGSPSSAQMAYIPNSGDDAVSVIDTVANTLVGTPILVGKSPVAVAVAADGRKVYIANSDDRTVSVIDTATNTVIATVSLIVQGTATVTAEISAG